MGPEAALEKPMCPWIHMHDYPLWKASNQLELVGKVWKGCLGHPLLGKKQADWETPPVPEVGLQQRESGTLSLLQCLCLGCLWDRSLTLPRSSWAHFISQGGTAHSPLPYEY